MKGDRVSLVASDSLSKGGHSNGSKTIKKYANMSYEMEQLDLEACEFIARIRSASEAMEWDTQKVALSKEQKDAEFKKIKADMDKARTLLQVCWNDDRTSIHSNLKSPPTGRITRLNSASSTSTRHENSSTN